jgi:hypothetical protein
MNQPTMVEEAIKDKKWKITMDEKMQALMDNKEG